MARRKKVGRKKAGKKAGKKSAASPRKKRPSRAKKSRTHVFDVTGFRVKELQRTALGRRIIELSNRNLPEDIAFVEDELTERFKQGNS